MSRTRDTDYANSRRVLTGNVQKLQVPLAVLGQLLSELDDGARAYADEALGPLLVNACITVAYRDDDSATEEAA